MILLKLSIIIPVYNTEPYLRKCIESVLFPSVSDYEIIIVNDGSTDSSPDIAAEYSEKYPSLIRLISTSNGGLGAARDVGIENSCGDYFLFLDSDDYLAESALYEIMSALSSGHDMYIFDFLSVNPDGSTIQTMFGSRVEGDISLRDYPALLSELPAACNKLFKRGLFTETGIRFPSRVWFEDLRTVPKLYLSAEHIRYIRKPWYHYVQRPGSITNNSNTERNTEIIAAVDEILNYYRSEGQYEHYKNELEFMAFYNQFLTSSTRVLLSDRHSRVQERLIGDFKEKFPDFESNPYYLSMSRSHRLLAFLLLRKKWSAVYYLMKANNIVKGRKT